MSYGVCLQERLNRLREIDELIDISRGTLQLDIILTLMTRESMSVSELASSIGERRKAVTDALRKLRNKGLVAYSPDGESVSLTREGIRCMKTLAEILSPAPSTDTPVPPPSRQPPVRPRGSGTPAADWNLSCDALQARQDSVCASIPSASVVSQVVMHLGTSKGAVPLRDLARSTGLSPQRLQSYIDPYTEGAHRIFKKYTEERPVSKFLSKLGIKVKKYDTYYALTQEGMQSFYKLPAYFKMKRSLTYRVLSRLTGTSNPRSIFSRLYFFMYGCGIASAVSVALKVVPLVPWAWAAFSVSVAAIALADLFLYRPI